MSKINFPHTKYVKETDTDNFNEYCNCDFLEVSCSKECVENIFNTCEGPFALISEFQCDKSMEMFSKSRKGKISRSAAVRLLKLLNFTEESEKLTAQVFSLVRAAEKK